MRNTFLSAVKAYSLMFVFASAISKVPRHGQFYQMILHMQEDFVVSLGI